jgi:polysaccharide biosynthesis transport protein
LLHRGEDVDTRTDTHTHVAARQPFDVAQPASAGRIDLVFLATALRRQASLIAIVVIGGLILTFLGLLMATPRYTATASLLLDTRQQKVFNADAVLPGLNDDLYIVESQLEILRSPRIATLVLHMLARDRLSKDTDDPAKLDPLPESIPPDVVGKFLRDLLVERKGRSYIVEVSYTAENAQQAATVANGFVDAYMADQLDAKFQATRSANRWLKERLQEIGVELEDLEQRHQKFRADKGLVDVGDVPLLQKEISEQLQALTAARALAAEAEARLMQVRTLANDPKQILSLDGALQSTVVSEYRKQEAEIQRKLGEAISTYGAQHPSVMGLKAQLGNLAKEMDQEIKRIIENRELAFDAATGKVKLLEANLQKLTTTALKLDEHRVKLAEFKRETSVSSELYSSLLRRYKETRAQEKLQAADARVVSRAAPPTFASYPKKVLVLLLASFAWLGVGAGLGLAREFAHRTIGTSAEVESALGVEHVATLPVLDLLPLGEEERVQHNLSGPIHWVLDDNEFADFGQSIFSIRKWTEACTRQGACVVLVVSAHPAEGCSTVAAQLALHAANAGTQTVLVDADLRSRGLSNALGIEPETSLQDILLRGADLKSALVRLPDTKLPFCPAPARGTRRPLDVLGSRATAKLFGTLRDEFDLIVVDTPPMSSYVDASALVEHADCVLVVVKADQTNRGDVVAALQRLATDSQPAVGAVLNMARPLNKE